MAFRGAGGLVASPSSLRSQGALPAVVWTLSLATFVLVWHWISRFYTPAVLPSPMRTLETLQASLRSGELLANAAASLGRVMAGFLIGAALGVMLGLLAGCIRLARLALDPYVNFLRFVPAIALLTPFVVWFGIGRRPRSDASIVFATLFIVLLNTIAGVDDIPVSRLRAAGMLGSGSWHTFALVVVPSTLPYIITGMRIAMGVSFATIVVAEMVSADKGTGLPPELRDGDLGDRPAVRHHRLPRCARVGRGQAVPATCPLGLPALRQPGRRGSDGLTATGFFIAAKRTVLAASSSMKSPSTALRTTRVILGEFGGPLD